MKKIIMVIVVLIVLVMTILNTSKNTSTTELLVSETKARNDIESIHGVLDVVGDGAYKGVEIKSPSFRGRVEQPASSATEHFKTYEVKEGTQGATVKYGKSTYDVTGGTANTSLKYVDLSLPPEIRTDLLNGTTTSVPLEMENLYDFVDEGIKPIIKDQNNMDWIKEFLLSDTGIGLEMLSNMDEDFEPIVKKIREDKADKTSLDLLKILLGEPTDGKMPWKGYESDRIIALKQINSKALTGLTKNASIDKMINPDLANLYQVAHVNTRTLDGFADKIKTASGITTAFNDSQMNKFVSHINQTIGGKLILIPNRDSSVLLIDGIPTFVLN